MRILKTITKKRYLEKLASIVLTLIISFSSLISIFPVQQSKAYQLVGLEDIGNIMPGSTDDFNTESFKDAEGTMIFYDVDSAFEIHISQINKSGELIWSNIYIDLSTYGIDPYAPSLQHDYIITDGDGGVFIFGSKVVDYGDNSRFNNNVRNIYVVHVLVDGSIDAEFPQRFMPASFDQEILSAWPDYQGGFGIFYKSKVLSDFIFEYRLQHVSADGTLLYNVNDYVDVPQVSMHCTNQDLASQAQIPFDMQYYHYGFSFYGWRECWEWCQETIDDAHPFCQYTATDNRSCSVIGAPGENIDNCTWDTLSNSLGNKWPAFYGVKQDLLPITSGDDIIMEPYAQALDNVGILVGESSIYHPSYMSEYLLEVKDAKYLADGDLQIMFERKNYEFESTKSIVVQQYDAITFTPKYDGMGIEYHGDAPLTDLSNPYGIEYNGKLLGEEGWYITQIRDMDLDSNREKLIIAKHDFDGTLSWQNTYEYELDNDVYSFSYDFRYTWYTPLSNLVVDDQNNLIFAWVVYNWMESDYFLMSFYQKYDKNDGTGMWGTYPNELVSYEYSVGNLLWETALYTDSDNGAFITFFVDDEDANYLIGRIDENGIFDDFNQSIFIGPWTSNWPNVFKGNTRDGLFALAGPGLLDIYKMKLANQIKVNQGYAVYSDEVTNFIDTTTDIGVTKDDNNYQNRVRIFNNALMVSSLFADVSTDRDWTNVVAQNSLELQKAFITGFDSTDGNYLFHDLYIPYDSQLPLAARAIVCPDATSFATISRTCTGAYAINVDQAINPLSLVSFGGLSYWKIPNLTGTGVMLESASTFEITPSVSQVEPSTEISVIVSALDTDGQVDTNYVGTIHLISQSGAVLPSSYTFTVADAGVHTFTGVKFNNTGTYTIMATDALDPTLSGVSANIISADADWDNGEEDPDIVVPPQDQETIIIDPSCATNTQREECQAELTISNVEIIDDNDGDTNIDRSVCWDTNLESQGLINYGTEQEEFYQFSSPAEINYVVTNHCINIDELENIISYFFKISSVSYAGKETEYEGTFDIGNYLGDQIDQPEDFIIVDEEEVISQSEAIIDTEGLLDLNLDLQFKTPQEATCYLKYGLSLNNLDKQSQSNTVGTVHNYNINLQDLSYEDKVFYEAYCQRIIEEGQTDAGGEMLYLKRGTVEMVQIDTVDEQKTVTVTVMLGLFLIGLISVVLLITGYLKITKKKTI